MVDRPGFGAVLARLLKARQADIAWLASASGVPEGELRSITNGRVPSLVQLQGLAAGLGLHTADLCVIAGVPVPESLQPCELATGSELESIIEIAMALPCDQRARLREVVEQLPQLPAVRADDRPRAFFERDSGPGSMLVTMLCANRNLHSPVEAVHVLARVTRGRMYVAASVLRSLTAGRTALRPAWLAGFATVLGVPVADLAAITGIAPPEQLPPNDPAATDAAELLWACRRLTTSQVEQVHRQADAMLVEVPSGACDKHWNRVFKRDGRWWGAPRR
ncbi:hypothetical protein ACSNOI_24340 [Actinomadura kijaniata]|uniref:hypothetical protein n=1 Tax=Actinomadura kijaniata TaxID=46161 RepID=UPI003F1D49AD